MLDVAEQLRRYGDWVGEAVEAEAVARPIPTRSPGRARLLIAVAAVLVLLVGTAVVLTLSGGDDATTIDQPDNPRRLSPEQLVVEARHLIWALQDERAATAIWLVGAEGVADLPVEDLADARRRTDSAIDQFASALPDDVAAYDAALDQLSGLAALRSEVDASPEPRSLLLDAGWGLVQRYSDLVTVILDANDDIALLADAYLGRDGVELVASALEADETTVRLSFVLLQGMVSGGGSGLDTPTEVSEASFQLTVLKQLRIEVVTHAEGTRYEDAARSLDQGLTEGGYVETLESFLGLNPPPLTELISTITLPSGGLWREFVDAVVADLDD